MANKLPLAYDLEIYCGTTFEAQFRWLPDGQAPQDFTGWAADMKIGQVSGRRIAHLISNGSGFRSISLTPTGQILLSMPPVVTALLPTGTYAYFLTLTDGSGRTTPFLRGRVEILGDVGTAP